MNHPSCDRSEYIFFRTIIATARPLATDHTKVADRGMPSGSYNIVRSGRVGVAFPEIQYGWAFGLFQT